MEAITSFGEDLEVCIQDHEQHLVNSNSEAHNLGTHFIDNHGCHFERNGMNGAGCVIGNTRYSELIREPSHKDDDITKSESINSTGRISADRFPNKETYNSISSTENINSEDSPSHELKNVSSSGHVKKNPSRPGNFKRSSFSFKYDEPEDLITKRFDQISQRKISPETKRLWVGKPRKNYFILGLIFGLLAIFAVDILWYLEYFIFKKPIDNSEGVYASCGGCFCIPDTKGQSCPSPPKNPHEYSNSVLMQLLNMFIVTPYELICNPFEDGELACIDPPLRTDLQTNKSVCAFAYDYNFNQTEFGCPAEYELLTYPDIETATEAGAIVTHEGGELVMNIAKIIK